MPSIRNQASATVAGTPTCTNTARTKGLGSALNIFATSVAAHAALGRRFHYHLQRVKDISTRSARQTSHHSVWDRARDECDQLPDQCFHARSINQAKHGDRPAIINGRRQRRLTQKLNFSPPKAVGHLLSTEENVIPKGSKLIQHWCTQRSHLRLGPAVCNHTRGSFGA